MEVAHQVGDADADAGAYYQVEQYVTMSFLTVPAGMSWEYIIEQSLRGCDLI